jgi:hypothetical protein
MMQRPVNAPNVLGRDPYREPPARRGTATRVHYRPGLSAWTILLVVLVTLPLGFVARRQLPGAQHTVTCTTAPSNGTYPCMAWDRATGDVRRVPCEDAQQLLDDQLELGGLLTPRVITVVSTVSPVESQAVPASGVFVEGANVAVLSRVPRSSASDAKVAADWNKIKRPADGTITPASARALLALCAAAPRAEAEHRTVALMIVPRDDRGAAGVLLVGLILLAFLLARSAVVEIDPNAAELRVRERFGPFTRRAIVVRPSDVADILVTQGAKGPLLGRRVELVLRDGSRVPLVSTYTALSTRSHDRVVSALRSAVGSIVPLA